MLFLVPLRVLGVARLARRSVLYISRKRSSMVATVSYMDGEPETDEKELCGHFLR